MKRFEKIIANILLASFLLQPLGLISPVSAETVDIQFDNAHPLHAPGVVNGVTYVYDANGNLLDDGKRTIDWNQDNKPIRITREVDGETQVVELFYDAGGRRILKKSYLETNPDEVDTTTYISSAYQKSVIDGIETTTKYYFANGRVAVRNTVAGGNSELTFLHQDHLGSTVLATDSDSQPTGEALSYFPYGNHTQYSIPNTKYLFTGQEKDPESDLYNYNARLYNPTTGIFISADSVGGGNRYAYAANNPMRFTDPSGNNIWDEIKRLWDEISGGASFLDALTFSPSVWVPGLGERVNPIISQEMQESAARQYDPLFYINIGDERIAGPSMFHLQMATQFGMVQQYDAAKAGVGAADALWRDRNRALVRAPQGVDPEDMANVLVEEYGFTRIDIQEMIDDDFIYIPKTVEKAVISFDPSAVGARGSGNVNIDVQGAIRGWFQGQQGLGKDPRLLVISAGEIDPAIFTDPDMWWFNGPFDPGFWEIDMAGSTMRRYSPNIREGGWRLGKEIPF